VLIQGEEQVVDAAEVRIESAPGEACLLADRVDAEGKHSGFGQQALSGFNQPGTGVAAAPDGFVHCDLSHDHTHQFWVHNEFNT